MSGATCPGEFIAYLFEVVKSDYGELSVSIAKAAESLTT